MEAWLHVHAFGPELICKGGAQHGNKQYTVTDLRGRVIVLGSRFLKWVSMPY
jgi:hypothetical protein